MTVEEFLRWQPGGDIRYELIAGVPKAMTPPKRAHGKLAIKLGRFLDEALDRHPSCELLAEAGVLSPTRGDTCYQADLVVSCHIGEPDEPFVVQPVAVVEVLSPTTEDHDRKVKLLDYRQIASVREVVLVDSTRPYCEVHRRLEGERWLTDLVSGREAMLRIDSVDLDLSLERLYAGLSWGEEGATPKR